MKHPCIQIYNLSSKPKYGEVKGVCRITGEESAGLDFNKWVRPTFNDYDHLLPGTIISNEALFCFDEASEELMLKVGKEKKQRFRTYSHIIYKGEWHAVTKADKEKIFNMICDGAELVCLTDTGQKHVLFKHRSGMWQLDDMYIAPDIELLKHLHSTMVNLLDIGFNQTSVITGVYNANFIQKNGFEAWRDNENELKKHRGTQMFDFAAWMLFINK